eukprot:scaffold1799_cov225-Pinguiococcus_pyrenoidosus.AAC.1
MVKRRSAPDVVRAAVNSAASAPDRFIAGSSGPTKLGRSRTKGVDPTVISAHDIRQSDADPACLHRRLELRHRIQRRLDPKSQTAEVRTRDATGVSKKSVRRPHVQADPFALGDWRRARERQALGRLCPRGAKACRVTSFQHKSRGVASSDAHRLVDPSRTVHPGGVGVHRIDQEESSLVGDNAELRRPKDLDRPVKGDEDVDLAACADRGRDRRRPHRGHQRYERVDLDAAVAAETPGERHRRQGGVRRKGWRHRLSHDAPAVQVYAVRGLVAQQGGPVAALDSVSEVHAEAVDAAEGRSVVQFSRLHLEVWNASDQDVLGKFHDHHDLLPHAVDAVRRRSTHIDNRRLRRVDGDLIRKRQTPTSPTGVSRRHSVRRNLPANGAADAGVENLIRR